MNLEQIYSQVILEKINAAPVPVQRHMEAFKMHLLDMIMNCPKYPQHQFINQELGAEITL